MTMIAYTRTACETREAGFKTKKFNNVKAATSKNSLAPMGHIPQTGTRETMCGRPMYEQVDVDEDATVKICKICQNRLRSTMLKFPGSDLVRSLLGNNLLPAGDHLM